MPIRPATRFVRLTLARLAAAAALVLLVAACGGDRSLTAPALAPKGALLAIGTDPVSGASITTNKDDYAPGEIVHLAGAGWAAGETVHLDMSEEPNTHPDVSMDVEADATGAFSLHFYDVQDHDLGVTFTLVATGQTSGSSATAVFTDGATVLSITSINPSSPAASTSFDVNYDVDINGSGAGRIWKGTQWWIDSGTRTCVNTSDRVNVNGTTSHTLTALTAPSTGGSHTLGMQAYEDDLCTVRVGGEKGLAFTVAGVTPNAAPDVSAGGPYSGNEGGAISIVGTATDSDGSIASTLWTASAPAGVSCTFGDAAALSTTVTCDDDASVVLTLAATDDDGATSSANALLTLANVSPTATFANDGPVNEGSSFTLQLNGGSDVSSVDLAAGLTYAFDCGDGSGYGAFGNASSTSCPTSDDGTRSVRGTIRDKDGGSNEYTANVSVLNVSPTATFTAPANVYEGSAIALSLTNVVDPGSADVITFQFDCGTGSGYAAASGSSSVSCPTSDNGSRTVKGKVLDDDGGSTEYTASVTIVNVAPTLTSITPSSTLLAVNNTVTVTVAYTDPAGAADDPFSLSVNWDDGSTTAGAVSYAGGSLSHTYTAAGVYTVCAQVTDKDGAPSNTLCYEYVVVYDPAAGFVTGGGWINSPAGAYLANPGLTGKATFGFVSKYLKGANTPTGNTEFQFHAAGLNFSSTLYNWLVVSGTMAQYKGEGTVNGVGGYGFLLSAVDGSPDKFRIKIFVKATNDVIYDNQGGADDAVPSTSIAGGSIVIHTARK